MGTRHTAVLDILPGPAPRSESNNSMAAHQRSQPMKQSTLKRWEM